MTIHNHCSCSRVCWFCWILLCRITQNLRSFLLLVCFLFVLPDCPGSTYKTAPSTWITHRWTL